MGRDTLFSKFWRQAASHALRRLGLRFILLISRAGATRLQHTGNGEFGLAVGYGASTVSLGEAIELELHHLCTE